MKKILSVILAMAIILSCFATCMVFSVSAAQTDYLNVVAMSGHGPLGNRQGINGTGKPAGDSALGVSYKESTTYRTEPGAAYVSNYTLTQAYNGDYILSSVKADEVFKNNVAAPEYLRYQARLSVTCENSVIMYVEIPNYEAADETWGFGLFEPTTVKEFTNASGLASRKFKRTEDITEGFSYLSVDGKKWVNGTMYKVADGEKVMKTDLPSGFKGYIRFDLSLIPILSGDNVLTTDVTTLYELDIAYNAVGTGDFVVGGLMYATTNANSTVLNFNSLGVSQLANVNIPEYIKVLGLSGNNSDLGNKQGINGTGKPAGDSALGVKYTGSKTYRAEAGENYVSDYANTNLTPNYSGNYIFSSNTENVFINDAAAPEYFRYQSKLDVTENDAIIMYVEIPDYTAAGQKWGLGLYEPSEEFKNANKNNRFFKRNEDLTEGFSYLSIDGKEWKNGTIYKLAEGEKVMKTDLPSGFKGYIRFDLSKIDTVAHDANHTVKNDITWLNELNFAYNAVGAGNFVLGGLMYRTTTADDVVFNFNDVGFAPLTNEVANYINVSCLSGNNGNIANKLGVDGTSYPNGDSAVGVKYIGSNTYRAEPGEKYVEYYENSAFHYSGNNIFSSNTNKVFINDETAPQYFRYISKLAVTEESSVIMYVELPDYELASEKWGLGLYESASEFTNAKGYNRFFDRSKDITEGFSYLSIDGKEWKNGTIYAQAEGEKVMKTDLPSGFKGYIRFDLSKMTIVNIYNTPCDDVVTLQELDIVYNNVGAGDFVIGGLMYKTTSADDLVFNFNDNGFVPLTNNILSVRAQNLITDKANTTNLTGTNIKLVKGGSEADTNAVMKLAKSGGLFLDDGYAASFTPNGTVGSGVLMGRVVSNYNTVREENLGLQLKAGVNKFMFYVELPDVRDFEGVIDEHNVLATKAIWFTNDKYVEPYGSTYEYMDIRDGEWHESTIVKDGDAKGAFSGLPTDGFKGYIKMDLSRLVDTQTSTYTIKQVQLLFSRCSWGRPLVIGGFYAIDVDSSATKPYFMDTNTGEMAATEVVPCDFTGDNVINAADLTIAIKYLIDHPDVTGIQASRAVSLTETKGKFTTVTLVQMKKKILGYVTGFSIDKDLEASTSESDVILTAQNPDRGFRMKSFVSIEAEPNKFSTDNLTQWDEKFETAANETNPNAWVNPKINKVYFRLDNFVDGGITENAFTNIQKVFDVTRSKGKTLIVRFYYNNNFEPDKDGKLVNNPPSQKAMLANMQQIKENGILERNKDVLHAVEAGFLGRYGEWHTYYDNYYINPDYQDANGKHDINKVWAVEAYDEPAIIRGILDMVPEDVYVFLRQAKYRDMFLDSKYAEDGDAKRLGLHNDSFMVAPTISDMRVSEESTLSNAAAAVAPMSGEFYWGVELKKQGITINGLDAILNFKYYRQNTFSVFHNSWEGTEEVAGEAWHKTDREGDMARWARTAISAISEDWLKENNVFYAPGWFKDANGNTVERTQYEFVRDYLGYKLEAKHLKVTGNKARGADVDVEVSLVNYGFSAPFNMTSEIVVLDNNNKIVSRVDAGNALDWVNTDTELKTHTINATITLPETAGRYKIALYVHNRAGTGAYLGNNIEQVNGFNILTTFGI